MKNVPDLSKAEYDVLRILWKHGELSVREVFDEIQEETGWAYTTTKTVMDRMVTKKLLKRAKLHGVYVYQPQISRPQGLARFIHFFTNKILEVDRESVLAMFTSQTKISKAEVEELKKLLKDLDGK